MDNNYTVVIPTYNEEATIKEVCGSIKKITGSMLVIDGNSTDRTRDIAESMGIKVVLQKKRGKGAALRQAIDEVNSGIIVFIDADCSHEASDIPKLLAPILEGKADLVIGSRYLGGSDELNGSLNNFIRMVGSSIITLAINYRWGQHLTDVENGFRAIKRSAALDLKLKANDFTIEQEMVIRAAKKKYRIIEVPSHEYLRKGGQSKLSTVQGWKFILEFLREFLSV
jgi:dolichol-phosphate mannosyltransferase